LSDASLVNKNYGTFVPENFPFLGTFDPKSESNMELSFNNIDYNYI